MNSQDRCLIVLGAKVRLLSDSWKRKTLKESRDFPIFQRKIPTGLLFPTESSNFAAMMRRLLLICCICMAAAVATAQNTAFKADTLSDEVFTRMAGRSFPEGCTIDRHELRYLRVLHIDHEGQVRQGELVCNRRIANDLLDISFMVDLAAKSIHPGLEFPIGLMITIIGVPFFVYVSRKQEGDHFSG